MTGLELLKQCGYNVEGLTETDAERVWMHFLRTGISGPRSEIESFIESIKNEVALTLNRSDVFTIIEALDYQSGCLNLLRN